SEPGVETVKPVELIPKGAGSLAELIEVADLDPAQVLHAGHEDRVVVEKGHRHQHHEGSFAEADRRPLIPLEEKYQRRYCHKSSGAGLNHVDPVQNVSRDGARLRQARESAKNRQGHSRTEGQQGPDPYPRAKVLQKKEKGVNEMFVHNQASSATGR